MMLFNTESSGAVNSELVIIELQLILRNISWKEEEGKRVYVLLQGMRGRIAVLPCRRTFGVLWA